MYLILTLLKMLLGIKELVFSFNMMLQLLLFATMFLTFISNQKKYKKQNAQKMDEAPGPKPWPILGSLHLMAAAQLKGSVPYAAFTALKNIYGNVFSITLGATKCVVVNDEQSVREVLISKDSDFDSRPDFKRFDALFGGDKQNSLAFCNYTKLQTKRRRLLQKFTFPHAHSANWDKLDQICQQEMQHLIHSLKKEIDTPSDDDKQNTSAVVDIKELIMKACGNIFNEYFCSRPRSEYDDQTFTEYVQNFDKIFWEVNNGRACDFLPWLMPFLKLDGSLKKMEEYTSGVRAFVEEEIIEPKKQQPEEVKIQKDGTKTNGDFLDSLMTYINEDIDDDGDDDSKTNDKKDNEVKIDRPIALYALEDILGGHCAVGNITLRIINDLAKNNNTIEENNDSAQRIIQREVDANIGHGKFVTLDNKKDLHWMTAAIHETIRLTCSPIVPHQASKDSSINGYHVEKGTVIFINNHELSMSESLWSNPEAYKPSRFLEDNVISDNREILDYNTAGCDKENNNNATTTSIRFHMPSNLQSNTTSKTEPTKIFKKPSHFHPFSMGRRSCMGYKIVQNVSYSIVASLLQHFTFDVLPEEDSSKMNPEIPLGMLALAPQPYYLRLTKRQKAPSTCFSESSLIATNCQLRTRA